MLPLVYMKMSTRISFQEKWSTCPSELTVKSPVEDLTRRNKVESVRSKGAVASHTKGQRSAPASANSALGGKLRWRPGRRGGRLVAMGPRNKGTSREEGQ